MKVETKNSPKINDKGLHCVIVGHSEKHATGIHMMCYSPSNTIYESRDIT